MTILFGFTLASFSTGLNIFMTVHAIVTGGYPFYHPVELFCIRALSGLPRGTAYGDFGQRQIANSDGNIVIIDSVPVVR
jgi:hypothetical protein